MAVWYFSTNLWDETGSAENVGEVDTLWGRLQVYRVSTFELAASGSSDGDIITPDPDSANFVDSDGNKLDAVTLSLETSETNGRLVVVTKKITIAGGSFRLRFDGGGQTRTGFRIQDDATFTDVDFVNLSYSASYPVNITGSATFNNCVFAGLDERVYGTWSDSTVKTTSFNDCSFFGNKFIVDATVAEGKNIFNFNRCTLRIVASSSKVATDCINYYGLSNSEMGFFTKPPKKITSNGIYEDSATWTNNDWEDVDLYLDDTNSGASVYLAGNSVTSASGEIYDVAGNKRKVGGALGAYENYSNVTHWRGTNAWYSDKEHSTSTTAPTSTSIVYLDKTETLALGTVNKIYASGWIAPNLGASSGVIEVGKNAKIASNGNLTLQNWTGTTEQFGRKFALSSPAKFTFKDGTVSES